MKTLDDVYPGTCWTRSDHRDTYVAIVSRVDTDNQGNPDMIHWTDNNAGTGMTMARLFLGIFSPVKIASLQRIQ